MLKNGFIRGIGFRILIRLFGLILSFLVLSQINVLAQHYKVNLYTQENGLQNELVKSIAIDSLGFLWAGTDYGLVRFNGEEFIDYDGLLSSNYVKSVYCDHKGRVFVNCDLGFEEINYTKKSMSASTILEGGTQLSDSLLWYPKQFYEDTRQNLWFSDNATVYRYTDGQLYRYYLGSENTTASFVHSFSFCEDGNDHLIMVSYTGNLYRYDYDNDAIRPIFGSFDFDNVTGIQRIAEGHILIGVNNMLGEIYFDPEARYISHRILDINLDASSFLLKEDGSVFVGSWTRGLWEASLNRSGVNLHRVEEVSGRGAINQIIRYKDEYVLATDYGIMILQNQIFVSPFDKSVNNYIQDVEYDEGNGKILFTDGDFIYQIDEESLIPRTVFESPGYLILQVLPDNNSFWFSDNQGILREVENGYVTRSINLSGYGSSIYNLIFDDEHNMWLCQDGLMGVIKITPNFNITVYDENYGIFSQVNFIKTTPYPHLVLGTNSPGRYLLYYDPIKDTILNMSKPLDFKTNSPFSVNDIIFDNSKVLWMATNHGMFMVKGNEMRRTDLEFQTAIDIKAITLDQNNNIWFASSTGVSRYDGRNVIPFDQMDGLPSKTLSYRSLATDSKNRIWAGSISGIAYNNNNKAPVVTATPIFLSISEKGIPVSDPSVNSFNNLTYLGFNFVSPEYPTDGINYLIKMNNKDDDWKFLVGRNDIFYSDLAKGEYQLLVKARKRGNYLWSTPLKYNFKIHTIWYQSWITIGGAIAAFFLAVFLMTKWRNIRLEREKKKLNKLVHERTEKLERTSTEIEAKNKQLVIAKEEAERSTRVKADFLSTMSHEIRTPLNGVLGMINIMLLENPTEQQLDRINTMKFSAENLLTLINDILDFNKIDEGKLNLEAVEFNLPELARNVRAAFEHAVTSKKIKLVLELAEGLPDFVIGDPTRLSQILTNLLGNAIKFTEKGEVKLVIYYQDIKKTNRTEVFFRLIDSGIGISPEQLQHIFESFSQASSDTTRKYGGSGLGLAITKKLLELMGSRVLVKSKLGVGSEFSFKLEFEKSERKVEVQKEVAKVSSSPKTLSGLKVLLVEDNLINIRIAKQILEKWEIIVEVAQDGQIAINKFRPGKFDLIFMDLHMPNVDGFEATRAIRKMDAAIPIVALTAAIKIQDKDKVLDAGMNEFVSKPFKPKELFELINDLVNNSQAYSYDNKVLRPEFESLKGYKVLLVEDNDINIKIATQFLLKWDLEVDVAKDGQIAIDMFEPDKYHLILMDLHLPNVDGYAATKAIRERDRNIPIIALTAAAMVQEKERVLSEGMNDFISKPFKPRDLYNKITNGVLNATLDQG